MKVALFVHNYSVNMSGLQISVNNLKSDLEKHGHEVIIITNNRVKSRNDFSDSKVLKIKKWGIFSREVKDRLDYLNVDVVEVHSGIDLRMTAKNYARRKRLPIVQLYHRNFYEYFVKKSGSIVGFFMKLPIRLYSKYLYFTSDQVICSSDNIYRLLTDEYGIQNDIAVVDSGIDLKRYHKIDETKLKEIRNRLNYNDDDFVVLILGALKKAKSQDEILKTIARLRDCEKLKLLIVGDGPEAHSLKALANHLNLNNVIFTGRVPHEDVPFYYNLASCLVLNARLGNDGMPILEALASSLPVVCYDNSVYSSIIRTNQNGIVYQDLNGLEKSIRKLYKNPEQVRVLASYAELSSLKYSNEYVVQRLETIYKEVITRKKNENQKYQY